MGEASFGNKYPIHVTTRESDAKAGGPVATEAAISEHSLRQGLLADFARFRGA